MTQKKEYPSRQTTNVLRDQARDSLVYCHLFNTFGLGVAEGWINLLTACRDAAPTSITYGWVLSTNPEANAYAKATHPVPNDMPRLQWLSEAQS